MEMHSFDFFNHSQFCSGKCQSRNYMVPKEKGPDERRKVAELLNPGLFTSNDDNLAGGNASHLMGLHGFANIGSNTNAITAHASTGDTITINNNNNHHNSNSDALSRFTLSSINSTLRHGVDELMDGATKVKREWPAAITEQMLRLMMTEPIFFWNEMSKFGLVDQFVDPLLECLRSVKRAANTGGLFWAAPALTHIISVLNVGDLVVRSIRSKPWRELHSNLLSNGGRKRPIDESPQSTQSRNSPDVKRPRVQYPTTVMTA
ncbi:hypothetical protein OSTOST_00812, partial [Ostertagia ostertagi]